MFQPVYHNLIEAQRNLGSAADKWQMGSPATVVLEQIQIAENHLKNAKAMLTEHASFWDTPPKEKD